MTAALQTGTHAQRQKRYVERKRAALGALPSPWAWLGLRGAEELLAKAYRTATWSARYQVGEWPTGFLNEQEMREFFVETLTEHFADFLRAKAVTDGDCWPVGVQAQAAPCLVAEMTADVPATWRPEYPQFAELVPGGPQRSAGRGAQPTCERSDAEPVLRGTHNSADPAGSASLAAPDPKHSSGPSCAP